MKKRKKEQPDASTGKIPQLIAVLEYTKLQGRLCSTGVERLKWWRRNGHKFPSIRAAMMTWTAEQRNAYYRWAHLVSFTEPGEQDLLTHIAAQIAPPLRDIVGAAQDLENQPLTMKGLTQLPEVQQFVEAKRSLVRRLGVRLMQDVGFRTVTAALRALNPVIPTQVPMQHIPRTETLLPRNTNTHAKSMNRLWKAMQPVLEKKEPPRG